MAQPKIGLGETIPRLLCLESGFGTRLRSMLSVTAGCASGKLVLLSLLPHTCVGLDMGSSLVAPPWFPILPEGSWVLAVLGSSFLEIVVVQVVLLVILRPRSLRFLVH